MNLRERQTFLLILLLALLFAALPAHATDPQPGDACSVANSTTISGGTEIPGGHLLVCDGSNWQPVFGYSAPGDRVMFNSSGLAAAPLHVWGEVIIGAQGLACAGPTEGSIRYVSGTKAFEGCDGTDWCPISGCDRTPDAFTFTDQTGVATSTPILSNTVAITGINIGVSVSITGDGSPDFRIDGGSWVTSGTITNGQSLQLRLTSNASANTMNSATVTVGTSNDQWDVTTDPCGGSPSPGDVCGDGTYYAGLSPDGNVPIYMTTAAFETTTNWNDGNSNFSTTGYTSLTDGDGNTAGLVVTDSDDVTGGVQPHNAAAYCNGLSATRLQHWMVPTGHRRTEFVLERRHADRRGRCGWFELLVVLGEQHYLCAAAGFRRRRSRNQRKGYLRQQVRPLRQEVKCINYQDR